MSSIASATGGRFVSMKPETRSFYEQAVQRAIDTIVATLDDALDLETLAGGAGL